MAVNGADVLLLIEDTPGVFVAVGSQRDVTFNETTEAIDVSNKTDGRTARFLPGRYTSSVDMDALFVPNDIAFGLLKQANRLGILVRVRRQFAGADLEEAEGVVTNLSDTHPDQDASTVSLTVQVTGPWQAV